MKRTRTHKNGTEMSREGSENLTSKGFTGQETSQAMKQTAFASAAVINIQMVKERQILYNDARLTTPEQAVEAFRALVGDPDREYFLCMLLDGKNRITGIHTVSQGSL